VLNAFDGTHVLSSLESAGVGTSQLAHAALHLPDAFIFVRFQPLANSMFQISQMPDSIAQQRRAKHRYVGADHEKFDDVFRFMNPTRSRQAGPDPPVQNTDPCE